MRQLASLALAALLAAACGGAPVATPDVPDTVVATATPAVTPSAMPEATAAVATASPTAEPTATPTAEPTAAEPMPVEIVRFSQLGSRLTVEIRNPNNDVGLVRSGFELAVIGEDGGIVTVVGGQGFLGAACCTIFQLPPGGRYALMEEFLPDGARAASVELTVLGPWEPWSELDPATVTLSNVSLRDESFVGGERIFTVTGRAALDQAGPFNVVIHAFVEAGDGFFVVEGVAMCVGADRARAFEGQTFARAGRGSELGDVVAYVTTVPGAGDTDSPPGCS